MKKIVTVGVVGAGTMGSALAQKFAQEGYRVMLADTALENVNKGLTGIKTVLNEGLEKKVFTSAQIENYLGNIQGTSILEDLKICDIIIEAIYEDFNAKSELFKKLSAIVPADTLLATNTSSFSVSELAHAVTIPSRFIGLHYFYHAAKNRLVEIIPGEKTSESTTKSIYQFAIQSGKDPIFTKDTYGFAINRFFVPWLNEAVRLLHEDKGSTGMIDSLCMKTFNIGMGPFALMNATGVAISMHAQKTLEKFGPSYTVSPRLIEQVDKKKNWEIIENTEVVNENKAKQINERMMGCVFFVCSQLLNEKVCSATDLNKGAKIGLKWKKGPVELMLNYGEKEVLRLVQNYAQLYNEQVPEGISEKNWKLEFVTYSKHGNRAVITMNRPEDLNALNEEVMKQLDAKFSQAEADSDIDTVFLTGSGKAFVAGADIRFFVKNMKAHTIDNIVSFTKYGQSVFEKIDKSPKKVIALLNGIALGGGLELALCADQIFALSKVTLAFPETGIGIYPGLGGTQRTSLRVGKGLAKYLVLTGKNISAKEAEEIGLIDKIISSDELFNLLDGAALPSLTKHTYSGKWLAYSDFYQKNKFNSIVEGTFKKSDLDLEDLEKLRKIMRFKAPVAMQFAEELIDEANGPASELEKLSTIFSTEDAMIGLSSIGQKVVYQGK